MRSVQFVTEAARVTFTSYLDETLEKIKEGARKKAGRVAMLIANEAKKGISGQRTGRRYKVPGTGRYYFASLPGEYPANRFGRLRASIQIAVQVTYDSALAIVGPTALYGGFLQHGTKYMAARPFLTLAYLSVKPQIDAEVRKPLF